VAIPVPVGVEAPPAATLDAPPWPEVIAPDDATMQRLHQLVFDRSLPHNTDAIT
jgi:hypothetical protein